MADKKVAPQPKQAEPDDYEKAYGDFYKQQTAENEATSKAVDNFVKSIPRKLSDLVISKAYKKGGKVKAKCGCMSSGGKVSSASKRADGCATKGKTKGRMI